MPLYEYQCKVCHKISEVIQKFSDPDLSECKECGGTLERLLSAPSIRFKGSGWYVNDYGKSNGNQNHNKEPKPAGEKESKPSKPKESGSDKKNSKVA